MSSRFEEILKLAENYFIMYRNQNKEKSVEHIIYNLYIVKLIEAYKLAKKDYFKLFDIVNAIPTHKEINEDMKDLKAENVDFKIKNNNFQKQLEILKNENERLKKDYKQSIEKENIKLHQQIQLLTKEKEEFLANEANLKSELKEFEEFTNVLLEESKNSEQNDSEQDNSKYLSSMQNLNVLILGGHNGWHNKLKQIIGDNLVCIAGNNVNFDKNVIDNKDIVFIYTDFMSHGFFNKIIKRMKNQGVHYGFLKSTSINLVLEEMYQIIVNL